MNEFEKRIKEKRTIEATKENYIGLNGMFGVICKNLGTPIMGQTVIEQCDEFFEPLDPSSSRNSNELMQNLPCADFDDNLMSGSLLEPNSPEWTAKKQGVYNPGVWFAGFNFDGLSRGMQIEITYLVEDNSLTVNYKGNMVYREEENELQCFVPDEEWQTKIKKLFEIAKKKEKSNKKIEKIENVQEEQRQKRGLLERIAKFWGV